MEFQQSPGITKKTKKKKRFEEDKKQRSKTEVLAAVTHRPV